MEIEIKVKGITLPLPSGYTLTREMVSSIFDASDDVYDFTYPVEIPLTDEVRIALGFPDIISNVSQPREYEGELQLNSLYTFAVTIKVLSVSLASRTVRISILGQYHSLSRHFGVAKVNMLAMGGPEVLDYYDPAFDYAVDYEFGDIVDGAYNYGKLKIHYNGGRATGFITAVSKGTIVRDYLFPKALDFGDIPGCSEGVGVINAWDPNRDCAVEADLINALYIAYPMCTTSNPYTIEERHFIVPMIKLYKVLKACFLEHGLNVSGDIIDDPEFQKIVLYNTHAINIGVFGSYDDGLPGGTPKSFTLSAGTDSLFYFPGNHLPDMHIAEFINEIGRRYSLQYRYDIANKHVYITRRNVLAMTPGNILDLTNKTNQEPNITWEKSDVIKGYKFSFEDDPADGATSEYVEDDISDYPLVHIQDFTGIAIPGYVPKDKDLAYVRCEDSYYQYSVAEGGWALYSRNICTQSTTNDDGLAEVTSKVISCPMMEAPPLQRLKFLPGFSYIPGVLIVGYKEDESQVVPYSKIGITASLYSYLDFEDDNGSYYIPGVGHPWEKHVFQLKSNPKSILPHVITAIGFQLGGDMKSYYFAGSGPYSPRAELLDGIYPGCWISPEGFGLVKKCWSGLTDIVQDSVCIEVEVLLDVLDYAALDVNNTKIIISGIHYLVKKAEITMPLPAICKLTLIRV